MAAPCACNGWLDGVPLPPKTDCPRCHGSGNLPASADEAADQLVARHGGAGAIRKLAETIEGINDEPGDVLLQEGRAIVALVEAQIWRSVTETITWLRKWADALQNYGTEVRAQVDGEVVWWMRKAADLLEAEAAPNLVALDNQELDLILSWYTYSPYDDDPGDDLAEKLKAARRW